MNARVDIVSQDGKHRLRVHTTPIDTDEEEPPRFLLCVDRAERTADGETVWMEKTHSFYDPAAVFPLDECYDASDTRTAVFKLLFSTIFPYDEAGMRLHCVLREVLR